MNVPLICSEVVFHIPIAPFTFFKAIFMTFMFLPWPLALGILEKETRTQISTFQVLLAVLGGKARSSNSCFGTLYTT